VRLERSSSYMRVPCCCGGGPRETFRFTLAPSDEPSIRRSVEVALAEQAAGRAMMFGQDVRAEDRVYLV